MPCFPTEYCTAAEMINAFISAVRGLSVVTDPDGRHPCQADVDQDG